ncbi:MAG TPA: GFA family protein, partial [Myxococcota bacterium]|nr:GFA family protein [Myxococcota bacterium]
MVRGSCLCGGIRFEYARAVSEIYLCHCSLCRKNSGAASNAVIVVPASDFKWLSGEDLRQVYRKPTGWSTTFCRTCGSPVPQQNRGTAAYWVPAG